MSKFNVSGLFTLRRCWSVRTETKSLHSSADLTTLDAADPDQSVARGVRLNPIPRNSYCRLLGARLN